jgi:hypothetical protein
MHFSVTLATCQELKGHTRLVAIDWVAQLQNIPVIPEGSAQPGHRGALGHPFGIHPFGNMPCRDWRTE